MEYQQRQHDQHGKDEDLQNLVHVGVGPAHQHRLTGGIQGHAIAAFRLAQGLQLGEGGGVVKLAFNQLRLDQRHLEVGGHQRAVDARVGGYIRAHLRQLLIAVVAVLRVKVGLGVDRADLGQPDLARVAVGDAGHQVVVDAGQVVDGLGDPVDGGQVGVGENVTVVEGNAHDQHVGPAEAVLDAVVQLDIGVFLRQQIGKVGIDFQPRYAQRKQQGQQGDGGQHLAWIVEHPHLKTVHGMGKTM